MIFAFNSRLVGVAGERAQLGPGERGWVECWSHPGPQADRGFRRCQSSDMEATCADHVTNGPRNSWLSSVELWTLEPNVPVVHVVPPASL
jgi:hypothetical protein